jgi:hypothetical protein
MKNLPMGNDRSVKGGDPMNTQWSNNISGKELSYINDSLKNEDLIAKLCTMGAVESQNPQLKQLFSQLAQERMQSFEHLLRTLQQQAQITQ